MTEEFSTYLNRDVQILRRLTVGTSGREIALIQSMGEPFYIEYAAADDSTYGVYEHMIWVDADRLESARTDNLPDDLPIAADAADDAPLPVELVEARAEYAQRDDLYLTGMGW